MTKEKIKETIRKHKLWLENKEGGERANFNYEDLHEVDLSHKDLSLASLIYTNISYSNLVGAKLNSAVMIGAQLSYANLTFAKLINAKLNHAILNHAKIGGTNLSGADLTGADLHCTNLGRAVLFNIKIDYLTRGIHPAPEGELIGWGKKNDKLVKMLIPAEAKRSCATTRRHRAEFVKVLWIEDGLDQVVVENPFGKTVYKVGQTVRCFWWDKKRWREDSGGIHFFLTRTEAEA